MPDDRLIHLALGHSEKINRLTDFERGVWLMYKLAADDFGVMRFSAVTVQDAAAWLEQKSAKVVLRALSTIRDVGLIRTFEHQGRVYCYQHDWQTWQKITHPRATKQPAPPLDQVDDTTRWLLEHHPNGGKLPSWKRPRRDQNETGNKQELKPESTGPVFVDVGNGSDRVRAGGGSAPLAANTRSSKRPIYTSDRFAVFEWQLEELSKVLGAHFEAFDLHAFFDSLSQRSRDTGLVIPKSEVWDWLHAQVVSEARRRGLPIASAKATPERDRDAEERAQNERVLALVQEGRRAGR